MDKKNRKWTLWRILSISQWKSIGRLYELPTCWDVLKECQPNNLFIWAYSPYTDELGSLGIIFYDQRKRHFGGKGITGGYIQLLSPTKIRWKLDEEKGIWNETEGDESISDAERRPIGFSVPDDVIMTKE